MVTNLSVKNVALIHSVATGKTPESFYGMGVHALYKLIQRKGVVVESDDKLYDGIKALCYKPGYHVAIIRDMDNGVDFYPCRLRFICLKDKN